MAKCNNCGKSGFFLRVNARGLCKECAEIAKSIPRSNEIVFTPSGIVNRNDNIMIGHQTEEDACQFFIDELVKRGKDISRFSIQHRSNEYTSLLFDLDDFIRIKMTNNVNWISISLSNSDKQEHELSELFSAQQNKSQRHWRSNFESFDSLSQYIDFAERACIPTTYNYDRVLTDNERIVANYLMQLFINCGADPDKFYCHILSQDAAIIYNSQFGYIRFKAYSKKAGGYIVVDNDFEEVKIKADKNRLSFIELSDLDFLQEKLIPKKIERGLDSKYSSDMKYYSKYPLNK